MKRRFLLPLLMGAAVAFSVGTDDAQAGLFGRRVLRQRTSHVQSRPDISPSSRLARYQDGQIPRVPGSCPSSCKYNVRSWSTLPQDFSDYGKWPPYY